MSPVAEYIKNVGKSVAYAAYDYATDVMPATSEFIENNNELFSDVYHSVVDLRRTMDKGMEAVQNTPIYRQGSKAFHNAIEDIKSGKLYNSEREDSVMSEAYNFDDDFNLDNLDSGDSSSDESSMTVGEKSIMTATHESANQISHATASAIEAATNYSVDAAKQNATMLYTQSVKTNATLEGGFKAVTAGLDAMYKFNTEVVQTMAKNSKTYFETTTKIMQENNAILKEMLEMQRNLYKRSDNAKRSEDPLFNIMGVNGAPDIREYAKQIFKNAKSLVSEKTWGMSDLISEDLLKQVAANPLKGIPTLMISTALGPAIKTTMQNLDKTLGGAFGSFLSKMNYMASKNSWGGSLGKEIMGKLFGVQLSSKESIDTSSMNSKITPIERSVVEVIPSHLSRIEAALTGNPARVYDPKKGKWTTMQAIKSGFKKDKESAIRYAGYEETSEMKDIMNKLVMEQAMNRDQVKHMEEVIQKINRKRFDDGGWLDRTGTTQDKAMRYGVNEEEWNLFEQLYSNISRSARVNAPGKFMRERLDRNQKLKKAETSSDSVLRLLFNDFDPANSMHIDSKKLQETGGSLGQNILHTKDKHGMTIFDYLRDIDVNTMYYSHGGGKGRHKKGKNIDDRSLREQELANRYANGMREGAAAGGDKTVTTANAGNESDNDRQINNLNINQNELLHAAAAVKDERHEMQMEENRTFITKYINEKMATEVQKMKANGASAQEIAKYRESMKKMVDAASDGGRFGAMTEAIQHLTARPVGVITGIMEQADKRIFNTLFEEEDRDDKDEEGKPAKGFFGKLKNRLDEVFEEIKEKINKRDEEIGNTNLSLFQKANALIREMTGFDVGKNLKNMKQGIINTGKSAFNQVKGALEGTARDIGLESWVDKLGKKKDSKVEAKNVSQTRTAADGARNVTKTGLTILSKGERIIPADQNIYNPDMRKVNRADNRRDEAKIKQQLIEQVRDANMMADGGTIDANGKAVKDNTKEKSMFAQFGERLGIWDSSNDKKITNMTQKEVEKYLPAVAGGGTAGAVIATATGLGGPLAGAIAGAAVNIAANSESFQKRLFGERIYDKATGADTGKRKGGIFGQEMQDTMDKYLPDAKKYGITGSVLGLVTPLGPLGGLMMGGAISFLKNNDTARNALFGENGLIGQDTAKMLRKAFPSISKTAIAGLLAGGVSGIGLIPGALVGAGIGLVSTTDEFKDFLLGTPDKDGKRVGGVAGAIKEGLVDPLKEVGRSVKDNFLDWFRTKMTKPIVDAMAPMGKQLQLGITGVFNWGKKLAKNVVNSKTGISLINRLRYSKTGRALGYLGGKAFGGIKGIGGVAKSIVEKPSAIIGGIGDRLRKSQIKSGNADYMTAEERLKFMGSEDYDMRDIDKSINGTSNEGIEEIRDKLNEIDKTKHFLEKENNAQLKKMGNHVVKGIKDTDRSTQIMDSIRKGKMKHAISLVESSKMPEEDKVKMIQFINDEGVKLRDIAMRKDNFKADRREWFKKLETDMGMKGINENNYGKYKKYFETEAAKRSKQDKTNAEALDTTDPAAMQAAEINTTLKTGFDAQIPILQEMAGYLSKMVASNGAITPEQSKALQGMKQTGIKAESKSTKKRMNKAQKKSDAFNKAFAGITEITPENQMKLMDMKNSERKRFMRIGDNGLMLNDVNKVLELKGKNKDRWFALAEYGYNITDMKLISSMSNRDFNKLMILAEAGIPITNIKAISKYSEHECEIMVKLFGNGMEIAQGGLYEFARKGDMTKEEFATKKDIVNSLEGSYEERIGLNRQEGVEQFSNDHTKQSKLARMGESMKESAKGVAHDAIADVGLKLYAKTHGFNNKNRKSGAIDNAGITKGTMGKKKSSYLTKVYAAAASAPSFVRGYADGGKITKDEVAVVSKGERIEPADSNKEDADKVQTQEIDNKAQNQKRESELDKATKDAKKDKKKTTSTVNTEYGPQEYKMSSDGSMVVAKTKQSMAVQKRILDRDNTQKELLASVKELVATNKESLKHSLANVGKKAKKGLFDLLKDLNPLNLLKKYGAAIASVLGPFAPLVLKGAGALGGLAKKGLSWVGGKVADKAKSIGTKALNTKLGQKIANSKVGKFASKIGGKLFGKSTGDDLDTSTPTNEMEAIQIHGSNTEKLLTKILEAIQGNNNSGTGLPDVGGIGKKSDKKIGKNGKPVPGKEIPGKKASKGRLGKLLAVGGGIAGAVGLGSLFGDSGDKGNGENYAGNKGTGIMGAALDAGANAMYTKDAINMASNHSSKFANLMNKGKDAAAEAASATKENTLAIVQKVKSGFNTVISKCGTLLGGAAEKLTTFKDWVIKKITAPASMKKILAKAGKHAAAYSASLTGIGAVVTVGMEVGFAMSSFYDGYNDAERILQIPAGSATTGMKMLCGFVSATLQAIPIIGWVLEPEDVIQGAISTVGAVFGVTEDALNKLRQEGDKAEKGISKLTNKLADAAQNAKSAASSVFSNFAGYGADLLNRGKEKAKSIWDKFTGYGSELLNKAGGMASNAANWVKDKASGAVDWAKDKASKVGSAISNEYEYAKNKVKSMLGFGKYKHGRGKWGRGFQSQQDPSIAGQSFSVQGDTSPETVDERACAETTGVNVLSALGMPTSSNDVLDAVDFAAGRGHVAPDDGTKDSFFKDYLGQYGVQTRHISPSKAADTTNPVILMGEDKSNTPDKEDHGLSKTPYGDQPHYVLGMGTDQDGNMTVVDPDTPDATPQKYRATDVLNHSSLAIEAGMGKFSKHGRGRWGKDGDNDSGENKSILSKVGDAVSGAANWAKDKAGAAAEGVKNLAKSAVNGVKNAVTGGPKGPKNSPKSNNNAPAGNSQPEFGGIFGDLADAASALTEGFSIGSPLGGNSNRSGGNIPGAGKLNMEYIESNHPGDESTTNLSNINPQVKALVNKFAESYFKRHDKKLMITGGAELGYHSKGIWSHGNGYKTDVPNDLSQEDIDELHQMGASVNLENDHYDIDWSGHDTRDQDHPKNAIYDSQPPTEAKGKWRFGRGKRSIFGRAKKAVKDPVIKAFNEYMTGHGPRLAYGKGKWGKGDGAHIWDYLKEQGLGSSAIAGIMGNMQAESSMEPNIVQGGGHADEITVDGSTGYGLCQWTDRGRQQGLVDFASARGTSTSDTDTQLDYMLKEIDDGHSGLLQKMDSMSPYDAALLFHEEYEASADSPQQAARRGDYANQIAQSEGRGETFNGTRTGGGNTRKTKKRGLFGKLTQMATALSDKMKKAIAPMAGAITSGASKIFGNDKISAIFGDTNPFSSIFSSPKGDNSSSGGGGGSFASSSSDEGIRKASEYAQSRVGTEGYGNNGCTTWCKVYLTQAGNPFANEMSLYVPTLMEQAKKKGIWKEADEPGCEGDIALLETIGSRDDGPDHAVIYDGKGGCWGNSSSKNKILHYDNMLASFPGGLWGYVATGNGGGTVATKEGEGQSAAAAAADSTMDGQGKWSSKWGKGKGRKHALRLSAARHAKHGKGILDDLLGKRDPKKELEMQAKLVGDKGGDAKPDQGIKTMEDVAAYIKDIPKASIPKYNRIKKGDSIAVARAKAIKAKQMFDVEASKDSKANPSIKMMEDISKMPQNAIAKTNKPVVSDPDNPLSGNDGINSVESARQYISTLPDDYKNNIPQYNMINDDDSIVVARAKALKIMEQYKKTQKNQPQETSPDASVPAPTEGKGKWGRGFGSWLKRIGGTIGDAATGLWQGMTRPGGIFGGPAAPFLKPNNSNNAKDNKKSLADEFENDIKYIMTAKGWQDKSGRNPSRAEAIEILKKDKKYEGKINDDGTIKDDTKKSENQKAADKIDTSYTENDITYIMTAREWQDKDGRNPTRAEAEKILQEQAKGKSGKGKWGRGFGSWLKRIGGTIGDAATGLWQGMTRSGGIFGGPAAPFLKPLDSKDTNSKKSLSDELENDIKYIMTAKEWQDKSGRNPSRAEAIEILKKDKKYAGKINDDGTLKDDTKKSENQKAAEGIDTSYTENDITYIMTAKEWQDSQGRNPTRAEAEKILQEQGKSKGKGKWGRGFGSWLKRIGGTIGDAATGLWHGLTQPGGIFGGPAAPFLKPNNSKDTTSKKSLADEFENDIKYIMTAKEWQDKQGKNPSRAEAIEILKKDKKYEGKINDDGTLKDETKKSENQKAADTSYTENDITYIMTAREWQDSQGRNPTRAEAEKILQEQAKGKSGKGKWGRRRHRKESPLVEQKKPSFLERITSILNSNNYTRFVDNHGINTMKDALENVKDIPADFQAKHPDDIINPDGTNGDSIGVARSKAIKMRELWEQENSARINPPKQSANGAIGKDNLSVLDDIRPIEPSQEDTSNMTPMDKILDSIKDIPEDFIAKYPYNRIDPVNDSLPVAKAKANALRKLYDSQPAAGMGKWGRRHHHRHHKQVIQPVNAAMVQAPVFNPFQTEDNPYGLNTMQDCLNLQSTIPEDFMAKYPYNRIDPDNDSLGVAKAKATKMAQLFDQQPAAHGKWGRGLGSWLKRIGGSIGDAATHMWHKFTGKNDHPEEPKKKEKSKQEILDNDIKYIMTAKEWQDKQGKNPSRAEAIEILNKDKKYNGSIDKDGKLIETKSANDIVKDAVKNPGTVKPTITKPEDIKTVDDAFNYISDIPESFIDKYPYNKIDPDKDDFGVVKSKAIKLRKLYDTELAKSGTTKLESKMAAQTINPNKPTETNTTEKNSQKTAEKGKIVEKKEETKATSTTTKPNNTVSDDSGIKAPNGKNYSNNDINYLIKQGYTKDAAIEILSKDKKYAAATPNTTTNTSDTKNTDSSNTTGTGEYNEKFDTMINLLSSIAQSVAVMAGTPAPQVAGAATTNNGAKKASALQQKTDAKVLANKKAAAQVSSQNMQEMFAGIATAMQKLARG